MPFLSKYLIRPQLEIAIRDFTEYGLGKIELGEGTVTHEGLRRILPRKIWVGPGVSARVATTTEKTLGPMQGPVFPLQGGGT